MVKTRVTVMTITFVPARVMLNREFCMKMYTRNRSGPTCFKQEPEDLWKCCSVITSNVSDSDAVFFLREENFKRLNLPNCKRTLNVQNQQNRPRQQKDRTVKFRCLARLLLLLLLLVLSLKSYIIMVSLSHSCRKTTLQRHKITQCQIQCWNQLICR